MAVASRVPPSPQAAALLDAIAARKIPGPVARSPERDRLRRLGYIVARVRDFRSAQDTLWDVTDEGRAYLAGRVQA